MPEANLVDVNTMERLFNDSENDGQCSSDGDIAVSSETNILSRKLTEEEQAKLRKQVPASPFKQEKLLNEARKNWDKFYLRNKNNFFKDRWWTEHEFDDLIRPYQHTQENLQYLEIGCGVGNLLFPLRQLYPHWNFYAFDFSDNAIRLLRERSEACNLPVTATVADLTDLNLSLNYPPANIASLVFVLSAIPPGKQQQAVRNVFRLIKGGGVVIIRDYGIYDYAMVRFGRDCKLDERFYARQDGTMAYYFTLKELDELFIGEGLQKVKSTYISRKTTNYQKNISVDRIFVQAVYIRPPSQ